LVGLSVDLPERLFEWRLFACHATGQELAELTGLFNVFNSDTGFIARSKERLKRTRLVAATLLLLADEALRSIPIRSKPSTTRKRAGAHA
jgi:hypothetical protein